MQTISIGHRLLGRMTLVILPYVKLMKPLTENTSTGEKVINCGKVEIYWTTPAGINKETERVKQEFYHEESRPHPVDTGCQLSDEVRQGDDANPDAGFLDRCA